MKEFIFRNERVLWLAVLAGAFFGLALHGTSLPEVPVVVSDAYNASTRMEMSSTANMYHVWGNIWLSMCTLFAGVLAVTHLQRMQ